MGVNRSWSDQEGKKTESITMKKKSGSPPLFLCFEIHNHTCGMTPKSHPTCGVNAVDTQFYHTQPITYKNITYQGWTSLTVTSQMLALRASHEEHQKQKSFLQIIFTNDDVSKYSHLIKKKTKLMEKFHINHIISQLNMTS